MTNHLHFNLGDMPPIGWAALIMIIAMATGKLFSVDWLFNLGAIGFGLIVIFVLVALAKEFFD